MDKLILLSMLLIGCGHIDKEIFIDEEFKEYVNTYELYYGQVKTDMFFGSLMGDTVATCTRNIFTKKGIKITVDVDNWRKSSKLQREMIIMHELGHCELKLGHNNTIQGGCPISIMNKNMFNDYEITHCYENKREQMIRDLATENSKYSEHLNCEGH